MARRCGTWLVVLALVVTTGGHWAVLQACAWAGMLVRFSQEGTVGEAISKTFDGRHPCRLCKLVREGRAEERGRETPAVALKFDLLAPPRGVSIRPNLEGGRAARFALAAFAPHRRHAPPVPPPRVA
jgi:hypothetical protein